MDPAVSSRDQSTVERPVQVERQTHPIAQAPIIHQPSGVRKILLGRWILGMGFVGLVLTAWEIATMTEVIRADFFSSPSRAVIELVRLIHTGVLWGHFLSSTLAFLAGWLLAIVIAVPLGTCMGWYRLVGNTLEFFFGALYSIPRIAIVPILILLIGIGMPYKITVVMLLTFFPILLNTITGIKNVDPSLVRMSRSFGSSDLQIFRTVALPSSVPYIITGIRQAVALGLVGVTVAELFASRQGLGYLIVRSSESFRTDTVYAAVLVLAFLGIVLTNLLQRIESYFARWRTQN